MRVKPKRPSVRAPATPSAWTVRLVYETSSRAASPVNVTARHEADAAIRKSSGLHAVGSVPRKTGGGAVSIVGLPSTRAATRRPSTHSTATGKWNSLARTVAFLSEIVVTRSHSRAGHDRMQRVELLPETAADVLAQGQDALVDDEVVD